jgi:phosphatidylethanolamine-binding protein (PEBP) family uncharacterized protein
VSAPALAAEFMLVFDRGQGRQSDGHRSGLHRLQAKHPPALSRSGEPTGTQSFAVTIYDPDARAGAAGGTDAVQHPGDGDS